jgi:hypothetical protein
VKSLGFAGRPAPFGGYSSLVACQQRFLRRAGVDVAVSRRLMRYSDVRLTLQIYNDDRLHDLHEAAVSRWPVIAPAGAGGGTATSAG